MYLHLLAERLECGVDAVPTEAVQFASDQGGHHGLFPTDHPAELGLRKTPVMKALADDQHGRGLHGQLLGVGHADILEKTSNVNHGRLINLGDSMYISRHF